MSEQAVRVLLVEDSLAEARIVRELLAGNGGRYELEHCTRIRDALAAVARRLPDVVLLDLNLPDSIGLDGFEALRARAPQVPVVIMTNVRDETVAASAVRRGAQDYLIKREVDRAGLARTLRYAIERQHAEQRLRASEERYALAVAGANDGIWDWDIRSGEVYYSPRWKALLGYAEHEIEGRIGEWLGRVKGADRPGLRDALRAHLQGVSDHFHHEHRLRTREGDFRWVLVRGLARRDASGRPYRMAGSLTDITDRKRAEEQLLHDALHDSLTGLPNRTLFTDRLAQVLRQYRRDRRRRFAVLFFDLDRFKTVNDSLGHAAGDELLRQVGARLYGSLRPGDTLARLGGDEFAILLASIDAEADATLVAERVHQLMAEGFRVAGQEVFTGASIGIAPAREEYQRPEEVLRDADLAMYRAKHSPAMPYEIFGAEMRANAVALLRAETELRRAVDEQQFVLHYQPIVSLADGRVLGFEALLRWVHPQRGLVAPPEFIELAEGMGLTVPLGWWVLARACRDLAGWQRLFPMMPPLWVSVNVTGKLFRSPGMAQRVQHILAQCGVEASTLRLEVTESSLMEHHDAVLRELEALRAAGVQLYIDDFGTGYSSLTNLHRFHYDTLKIDRTFVGDQAPSNGNRAIVEAIVTLGRTLGMNVIAEGVETPEQQRWLAGLGCPEAQGFWFSRPLASTDVAELLRGSARAESG